MVQLQSCAAGVSYLFSTLSNLLQPPQIISQIAHSLDTTILVDTPDIVGAHRCQTNGEGLVLAVSVDGDGRAGRDVGRGRGEVSGGRGETGAVVQLKEWVKQANEMSREERGGPKSATGRKEVRSRTKTNHMMLAPARTNLMAPRSTPTRGRRLGSAVARKAGVSFAEKGEDRKHSKTHTCAGS